MVNPESDGASISWDDVAMAAAEVVDITLQCFFSESGMNDSLSATISAISEKASTMFSNVAEHANANKGAI